MRAAVRALAADRRFVIPALAIAGTALGLRLVGLGREELWLDETASLMRAQRGEVRDLVLVNGALYYSLLSLWVRVAGITEAAVRGLSAVAGTLAVLGVMVAGRVLIGRTAALAAGLFAALSPVHIYYSQEARTYVLVTLLLPLTWLALWRALDGDDRRWWVLFAAAVAALGLSHHLTLATLPATAVLVRARGGGPGRRRRWLSWAGAVAAGLAVHLPVVAYRLLQPRPTLGIDWVASVWAQTPPWLALPLSLEVLALGPHPGATLINVKQFTDLVMPPGLRAAGLAILAVVGLLALRPPAPGPPAGGLADPRPWLWSQLLAPLALLWAASHLKPLYVVGRYDMVAWPALALLVGWGLARLTELRRGAVLAPLAALSLAGVLAARLAGYYGATPVTEASRYARAVDELVQDGDVLIMSGITALPLRYYLRRRGYLSSGRQCLAPDGRIFACRAFPPENEERPAVDLSADVVANPAGALRSVPTFLQARRYPTSSVWVVFRTVRVTGSRIEVSSQDAVLAGVLRAAGLRPAPPRDARAPGLVEYRPAAGSRAGP